MLTELYIEALLVDEELADFVSAAWDSGKIGDESALSAWTQICQGNTKYSDYTY